VLKFNIRYLLIATTLVGLASAIYSAVGIRPLFVTIALSWPSLVGFALSAVASDADWKVNATLIFSITTAIVLLLWIGLLAAIASFFVIVIFWAPQFLVIVMIYDTLDAQPPTAP